MRISKTQTTTHSEHVNETDRTQQTRQNSVWNNYNNAGNINGEIEPTMQGADANDCWLLSAINGLNSTDWGKQAIKNNIHSDNNGGAIITLYSPDGDKIKFNISAKEIEDGWNSSKYSSGDKDMIALEIAFEQYFKKYYAKEDLQGGNDYEKLIATKALSGQNNTISVIAQKENTDKVLEEIQLHPGKYSCGVSFGGSVWSGIMPGHAYFIKSVKKEGGKTLITMIDPYDSSKEKTIDSETFKEYFVRMSVIEESSNKKNPKIKSDKRGNELLNNVWKPDSDIRRFTLSKNIQELKKEIAKINKDNITFILYRRKPWGDDNCNLVRMLDNLTYGWGKGKLKRELISPIIEAACEVARENNLDSQTIENARKECYAELNAKIYTDIDVIEKNLILLLKADYYKKYL